MIIFSYFSVAPGQSYFPASNSEIGYPANKNQAIPNKDMNGASSNINNNQYGFNSNLFPNSNTYSGQTSMNGNKNVWPTVNNNNNNNNNNPFNSNPGVSWYQNRNFVNNNRNNNHNKNTNNNNAYSNPSSPYFYSNGQRIMISCLALFFSFIITQFFHI